MKISKNGIEFIERWEGCILQSYDDRTDRIVGPDDPVAGVLTIGVGHTDAAGPPKVTKGMTITKEEAEEILDRDLDKVEEEVNNLVKVPLTQNQFDTLVSFHFNTGALGRASALKSLNAGDYEDAAKRLTLYIKDDGRVVQGLVNRRAAEMKLFLTPDAPEPTQEVKMPSLPFPLNLVFSFINPEKIGGWVRALVASALTMAVVTLTAKVPLIAQFLPPGLPETLSVLAGTAVTGWLSNISKGEKVAALKQAIPDKALDHSRKD